MILTKPIGTGVIATALKFGRAPERAIAAAVQSMITLNAAASSVMAALDPGVIHACTDITGFGLVGHASEMAAASGCSLDVDSSRVPLIDGALALVRGNIPGGGRTNREHFERLATAAPGVDPDVLDLLYDPQTSGGLLAAVSPEHAERVLGALESASVSAVLIGKVGPQERHRISIR